MAKKYYVLLKLYTWDALECLNSEEVHVRIVDNVENGLIGFLPVFASREEAEQWGGGEIVEVEH